MDEVFTVDLTTDLGSAEVAAVRAGLVAYNRARSPDDNYQPFALLARNSAGELAGGLLGCTYWGWLNVEILWLADAARGAGLGTRLLAHAEQIALERGCHAAHLDTMSFQALPFYERHGYAIFGVLEDMPPGHQRYFLKKQLRARTLPTEAHEEHEN
jgi:GNAT superfamily N-acetyltransferase